MVMTRKLLSLFLPLALLGCSSTASNPALDQVRDLSGGQILGDATSLYWSTERVTGQPVSASDYVTIGDYGEYQTEYRWEEGVLRELVREGSELRNNELLPFRLHIRFNREGDAIYQRYRVDGNVLPVNSTQLVQLKQDASRATEVSQIQSKQGFDLIQGHWDGQKLETCAGVTFSEVSFNQPMPQVLMSRLATLDSYVALVGTARSERIEVEDLLILDDDSRDCISRPELIED